MIQSADIVLEPYLDQGEKLLWSGMPRRGLRLRAQDAFLIPFSFMWGGFAIFWEFSALHPGPATLSAGSNSTFLTFWGIPFVLIGLYIMVGRFFVDAWQRERTYYGVTADRIVILKGLFSQQLNSIQLRLLPDITFSRRPDGSGTISFGSGTIAGWGSSSNGGFSSRRGVEPPAFEFIENAMDVYDLIRKTQKDAHAPTA